MWSHKVISAEPGPLSDKHPSFLALSPHEMRPSTDLPSALSQAKQMAPQFKKGKKKPAEVAG